MDTNPVDIDMTMQSVGLCLLKCIVNTVVDFLNVLTDYLELIFHGDDFKLFCHA